MAIMRVANTPTLEQSVCFFVAEGDTPGHCQIYGLRKTTRTESFSPHISRQAGKKQAAASVSKILREESVRGLESETNCIATSQARRYSFWVCSSHVCTRKTRKRGGGGSVQTFLKLSAITRAGRYDRALER